MTKRELIALMAASILPHYLPRVNEDKHSLYYFSHDAALEEAINDATGFLTTSKHSCQPMLPKDQWKRCPR